MSGVRSMRPGDDLIARFVVENGAAYQAGIREGDILLELNGKPAHTYDMPDVHELMTSGDGKEVKIKYRRCDAEKTVTITLHRQI